MANLYEMLGVPQDAAAAKINRAYRSRVWLKHPDSGGTVAAFAAFKEAHDILSDRERRAHYDSTGEASQPKASENPDAPALATISKAFTQALLGLDREPHEVDFPATLIGFIENDLKPTRAKLRVSKRTHRRSQRLGGLISIDNGKENRLEAIRVWHLQAAERDIEMFSRAVAIAERAIAIIKEHAAPGACYEGSFVMSPMGI